MNQENLSCFVQLFTLNNAEATQRVSERLALVLRDSATYQEQYAEELAERGIEAALPAQELRDLALIDALISEDLLWENDWKETATEIADGLNEVLTTQKRGVMLPTTALAGGQRQGPEALDLLQDILETKSLALVLFTLDSDSYPLSVVAEDQVEHTRRLAKELGFEVVVY